MSSGVLLIAIVEAVEWFSSSSPSPLERALVLILGGPAGLPLGFIAGLVSWRSRRRLLGAAIVGSVVPLAFWVTVAFTSVEGAGACHDCTEWFGRPVNGASIALGLFGHVPLWLFGILFGALVQSRRHRRRAP